MTVEKKPVRLSKVAREFNIGISTIVEYLKKKGHEVESNPNTKISPELYSILLDEFKSEKTVKEEAAKIGLDFTNRETISIQDRKSTIETIEKEIEQEELIIKNMAAYQVDTLKQEEKAPDVPKIIEEKDSPIVKIPEEKEEVVEEKPPIEEKPEDKPKRKARAKKTLKETKEDAVEAIEKKKKTAKATTGEESKTKEADHPKEADVAIPDTPEADKASPLKIIGTIDLETIDPKKSAKKKTKEKEKKKEEESKKPKKKEEESKKPKKKEEDIVEKETVLEEKPKEVDVKEKEDKSPETELIVEEENLAKEENFIKTEFEKLKGPTII